MSKKSFLVKLIRFLNDDGANDVVFYVNQCMIIVNIFVSSVLDAFLANICLELCFSHASNHKINSSLDLSDTVKTTVNNSYVGLCENSSSEVSVIVGLSDVNYKIIPKHLAVSSYGVRIENNNVILSPKSTEL